MGMAASQARLLSITARMSNNENTGQAVSYSKQRLADQTQQITNEYNEALNATKLTVLTGFNGAVANYEDISYNRMTGLQMATSAKQYVVTDTKGRVLVTEAIADAYIKSKGNYNMFLAQFGLSQADISVQINNDNGEKNEHGLTPTQQQIHEAWDKYFASVGINKFMPEHDLGISFTETYAYGTKGTSDDDYSIGDGYAGFIKTKTDENGNILYNKKDLEDEFGNIVKDENGATVQVDDLTKPIFIDKDNNEFTYEYRYVDKSNNNIISYDIDSDGDGENDSYSASVQENDDYMLKDINASRQIIEPIIYEGSSQESRDLYDYAMAITEAYLRVGTGENGVAFKKTYNLDDYKSAANLENKNELKYYRNIFDKIQTSGFFTYTHTAAKATKGNDKDHYIYDETTKGTTKVVKNPLKDNYTFEAALRDGSLRLQYYSSTEKNFISTTISEDNCIQEVADERAIAKAESKYNQDMADLENKDKKFDLELKKLDTEHKALETEYESVKQVVNKNVETSFKIFS